MTTSLLQGEKRCEHASHRVQGGQSVLPGQVRKTSWRRRYVAGPLRTLDRAAEGGVQV